MAVIDLTEENFRETYKDNDLVVIDFWAVWCGPCHAFAPVFESVAEEFADVIFGRVNVDEQADIARHFTVRSIPTIMIIREGIEVHFANGGLGEEDLRTLIHQAQALNMEKVRKNLEQEERDNAQES